MNFIARAKAVLVAFVLSAVPSASPQGVFSFYNGATPTRIGSVDGPLAGTNIFARMLAGAQTNSLMPVGPLDYHVNGIASDGYLSVPGVPAYSYAYAQMWAWDSTLWGADPALVPAEQFGRTDIVPVYLTSGVFPDVTFSPHFTTPAVVPLPEPSTWALLALGAATFACFGRKRLKRK